MTVIKIIGGSAFYMIAIGWPLQYLYVYKCRSVIVYTLALGLALETHFYNTFILQIHAFLWSYIQERHAALGEKEHRRVTLQYKDLRHKADALKLQLNQVL